MSTDAVVALSAELRRLATAGAGLAAGDARVAALVPALEAVGARVPVFADMAARAAALTEADGGTAPMRLLALNTLVAAVLKARADTTVDGDWIAWPAPGTAPASARVTARELDRLASGLRAGRRDLLEAALDRGLFGDARLAPLALGALHAESAEIRDLARARLLPAFGIGVVPLLVASLDPTKKRPAVRTIEAIRNVDPEAGAEIARAILDPGSATAATVPNLSGGGADVSGEATAAALDCLRDVETDRAILESSLSSKHRAARVVALRRLLERGDAAAMAHATAMLTGSATKAREAVEALPALDDPDIAEAVSDRARTVADALDGLDDGARATPTLVGAARALLGAIARSAPTRGRVDLAMRLAAHALGPTPRSRGADAHVDASIAEYLIANCPSDRRADLVSLLLSWLPYTASIGLIRHFGTTRSLASLRAAGDTDLQRNLYGALRLLTGNTYGQPFPDVPAPPAHEWDVGWLDLALRHLDMPLARRLARGAPARVVETALAMPRVHDPQVLLTLSVDPGCAERLLDRLTGPPTHPGPVRAVCEALAAGDREAALALAGRTSSGRDRIDGMRELHDRLLRDAAPPDESSDRPTPSEPTP